MQRCYRGLAAALLCVVLFCAGGCSGRQKVYTAGLESEAEMTGATEQAQENQTVDISAQGQQDQIGNISDNTVNTVHAGYVYICGAVQDPGVYPIYDGMRVFEALELAGGFTGDADEQWLNQAERVSDGQRIYVYTKEETAQLAAEGSAAGQSVASDSSSQGTDAQERMVNINTADRETLMTLPGIGEAKADAILQYREEHGGFASIEEIQNISGIKNAVFSKIKDRITVQ